MAPGAGPSAHKGASTRPAGLIINYSFHLNNSLIFLKFARSNFTANNRIMDQLIKEVENLAIESKEWPSFKAGDTISVDYKIREGNKERVQQFKGVVIQKRGRGRAMTFTVRKVSGGMGVERIFPISSPFIEKIEVNKEGSVRRARIFYLRDRKGKAARIKEKRI
jgi:large subunit ribosomal protein L19